MYLKLHRYLIRQYLYPLLGLLFLLLLIKWNSLPKQGTTGSQFHDRDFLIEFPAPPQTMVIPKPITNEDIAQLKKQLDEKLEKKKDEAQSKSFSSSEKDLPELEATHAKAVKPSKKGNVVAVTIYMEAQCPDTTGFIKRQLVPTWEKLQPTGRINVTVVPFGKAHCTRKEEDYVCECQHGEPECDLNVLMNCVIDRLADPEQYISMLGCIQGKTDLKTAFQSCVVGHTQADWLWKCAHNKRKFIWLNFLVYT